MGLFSGLFSSGPKETTTTNNPMAGLEPKLNQLFADAANLQQEQYYPGQTIAGFTPAQLQGQQGILGAANQLQGNVVDPSLSAWRGMLGASDVANRPEVQGLLAANQRNVMDTLTREALPAIDITSVGYGGFGGSGHAKAQQLALDRASTALANANAGILSDAYGQGLGATQYALGAAPQMAELGFVAPRAIGGVGAEQQAMEQAMIDAEVQKWKANQAAPYERLQRQMAIYGAGQPYGSTTSPNPNQRQPFMDLVGAGLTTVGAIYGGPAGAAAGSSIGSALKG